MKKTFAQLKNIFTNVREKKKKNIQKQLTLNWADVKQDLYSLEEFLAKVGPNQIWRLQNPSRGKSYFFTGKEAKVIEQDPTYITLSDGAWGDSRDSVPALKDEQIPSYIALHDFPMILVKDTNESLNLDWAFTEFTFIPHRQWAAEIKDAIMEKKLLS